MLTDCDESIPVVCLSNSPGSAGVAGPAAADGSALEGKLDFDSVVTVVVDVRVATGTAAHGWHQLRCRHAG